MTNNIKNCYIHIPFCNSICSYCDFCKIFNKKRIVDEYLIHLAKEIKSIYKGEKLETIYIGGGTPSCLDVDQLKILFNILKIFNKSKDIEYTIECNFDSIDEEKLELFKNNGVNRLSFGLETINESNLKLLDRNADKEKIFSIISLCRKMNFDNINIDLMYAIPSEDLNILNSDIDFVLNLNVEHISTYSLIIEDHTKLKINNTKYISEDLDYEMYNLICKRLKDYDHYEISNFSKNGYQSRHNLCYWKNSNYYGFGLGASSYIDNRRINNTRSINKYLEDNYISNYEILKKDDIMSYEMILGLRTNIGVNKTSFFNKYGFEIEEIFNIKSFIERGLLVSNDNIFIPIDKWYISNEILVSFIKE